MTETRTKRPSRWLCATAHSDGLYALKEIRARTAMKAAEEYRTGEAEEFKGVVVVYPLRTNGEPAFFAQQMTPIMVHVADVISGRLLIERESPSAAETESV